MSELLSRFPVVGRNGISNCVMAEVERQGEPWIPSSQKRNPKTHEEGRERTNFGGAKRISGSFR